MIWKCLWFLRFRQALEFSQASGYRIWVIFVVYMAEPSNKGTTDLMPISYQCPIKDRRPENPPPPTEASTTRFQSLSSLSRVLQFSGEDEKRPGNEVGFTNSKRARVMVSVIILTFAFPRSKTVSNSWGKTCSLVFSNAVHANTSCLKFPVDLYRKVSVV